MTSPIFIPCTGYTEKCTYTKLLNSKWEKKKSFKPLSSLKTDTWPFISNSFCNTQSTRTVLSTGLHGIFVWLAFFFSFVYGLFIFFT